MNKYSTRRPRLFSKTVEGRVVPDFCQWWLDLVGYCARAVRLVVGCERLGPSELRREFYGNLRPPLDVAVRTTPSFLWLHIYGYAPPLPKYQDPRGRRKLPPKFLVQDNRDRRKLPPKFLVQDTSSGSDKWLLYLARSFWAKYLDHLRLSLVTCVLSGPSLCECYTQEQLCESRKLFSHRLVVSCPISNYQTGFPREQFNHV